MSETSAHADFDAKKAEAFVGRFLTTPNHGALCLMASIGHCTGRFDVLRKAHQLAHDIQNNWYAKWMYCVGGVHEAAH